jgi:membrane-associated protease RseP (regulator of RpoE activity)
MKKSNKRTFIIISIVLVAVFLVIAGTTASVLAYRQLADSETDDSRLPGVAQQEESGSDEISDKGILVAGVDPDSPASQAGLRRGAIILEVDGVEVNTPQELRKAINDNEAGETIALTVLLCDEPEEVSVTLASSEPYLGVEVSGGYTRSFEGIFQLPPGLPGEFNFGPDSEYLPKFRGDSEDLEKFFDELPEGFEGMPHFFGEMPKGFEDMPHFFDEFPEGFEGMPEGFEGMLPHFFDALPEDFEDMPHFFDEMPEDFDFSFSTMIFDIVPDSPADLAGLQKGDIVSAINGQDMTSQEDVIEAITANAPGDEISITVERGNESLDVSVALGEHPDDDSQPYLGVYLGGGSIHREFRFSEDEQNS